MKVKILILIFICFSFSPLYGEKIILLDEKKEWNIAITDFKITDSSSDSIYLGNSLPAFLYNQLSSCLSHTLSENEIFLLKNRIVIEKIEEKESLLTQYFKDYNMTFFNESTKKKELRDSIKKTEKEIRVLKKYNVEKIKINPVKEVLFKTESEDSEKLSFLPVNINIFADKNNFDYVLYGSAGQFDELVIIEIRLYSSLFKKDIYANSVSTDINSLFSSLDETVSEITSIILGTPWSKLTINTNMGEADIYLDNQYIGSSNVKNIIVKPGEHLITLKGQGIAEKELKVLLEENKENIINMETEEKEEKLTAINTLPPDADIYYDSLWRGTSPYLLNGLSGELYIKKEGYRDLKLFIDDFPENSITLQLSPDIFKKDEYFDNRRDTFYKNFSFFILSVPLPFFLFAVLNDYSDAYNNALSSGVNSSETERLRKITNFTYYGYYGSLFLTISLFVNTIFHLNDYIKAGDIPGQEQ
ncbi:MAG: PEGA domain-containing protein [Spirochaetia bacterium]|jgi:hypothetical protein|nr:PEGA domain-containing protein [Spirochaetia bacterium]